MNEKGFAGTVTTIFSAIVSVLPTVNLIVQIGAGITAIVVGIYTARYYIKKTKQL